MNPTVTLTIWQAAGGTATTYTYSYDQLNRLKQGLSTAGNNESNITYDPRGNILTLNRYATSAVTLIDRLTYLYPLNSNQLSSVTDDSGNALGQKTGTATYGYDPNGNLTSDNSRGIPANGILYNLLNLPQSIAALNTTYTYYATGQKLRKVITGTGASTTEYIGGIQYNGTAVDFIQTEEGRALPNGVAAYNYEYSLTDHLGNNRVNFDTGTGTTARQVQTDDYYPFGMESNSTTLGTKNLYLYNKKELQQNGLNLYDYGARFYDPVIGRWTNVDPLGEKGRMFSPYTYGRNNPIIMIDPDGMFDVHINGQAADKAEEELQKSVRGQLTLSRNSSTGNVTYVKSVPDELIGDDAKQLIAAIDDHTVNVNINASNGNTTPQGALMIGGAFGGNTVTPATVAGGTPSVVTNQDINPNVLAKSDAAYGADKAGNNTLHEVTESYQGGKISQRSGISSGNSNAPGNIYRSAHAAATQQVGGFITQTVYNAAGQIIAPVMTNGVQTFPGAAKAEFSVQPPNVPKVIILTIP